MRVLIMTLGALALLAGCGLFTPTSDTSTTVNCEGQAGASVRCPDKNFAVDPPPAELKQGG